MPIDVQFPGNLGQVDTIAKLRQVPTSGVDAETVYIAMDVGRTYSFDFGSLLNDDGINVIRPNDRTPLQAGRFIYLVDGFAPGNPGAPGPAGPADNTYTTLAALLASDPTRKSARLVPQAGETAPAGNFNYVNGAWVRQGTDGLTFQPLGATEAIDAQAKLRQTVAVTDYPGSPNEQWAAALAAVAAGGEIILPQGVTMTYDVSSGFAGALNVNKSVTIRILGRLQTNGHGTRSYIFRVTSAGVKIIVEGVLAGDGSVDDANSGDITTHPGLIYVEANGFRLSGPGTIDTPPKVAVVLANCYDCVIEGVTAVGGPANYSGTAYFFAIATGGGRHKFTNLKAPATTGAGNAKFVNLIFFGGSLGDPVDCIVSNCSPVVVWEKVAYAHGSGHLVQGNKGAGDKTDWIRLWGDNNRAEGNEVSESNGVVTVLDGKGCVVQNNKGFKIKQTGIVVARNNSEYAGGFSGTIISGNVLISDSASSGLQDGILIIADGVNANDIQVINNAVSGFSPSGSSRAQIKVSAVSPYAINRALIANNVCTDSPGNAIVTDRVIASAIQGNQGRNIGGALLSEVGGAFNRWLDNTGDQITNKGVQGISSASEKSGNRFTNGALTGQATLAAGTITVSNTEVLDGDEILLSVAASGGTPGFLSYSIVAGTSFTIVSSSNTDASVVRWRINH